MPDNFPEKTEVSPLVDAMVEIDTHFDDLKLIKKAGYAAPPTHPDLAPAHEALLLNKYGCAHQKRKKTTKILLPK